MRYSSTMRGAWLIASSLPVRPPCSTGGGGMLHVFPANLALLKAATEALDIVATFLRLNLRR